MFWLQGAAAEICFYVGCCSIRDPARPLKFNDDSNSRWLLSPFDSLLYSPWQGAGKLGYKFFGRGSRVLSNSKLTPRWWIIFWCDELASRKGHTVFLLGVGVDFVAISLLAICCTLCFSAEMLLDERGQSIWERRKQGSFCSWHTCKSKRKRARSIKSGQSGWPFVVWLLGQHAGVDWLNMTGRSDAGYEK